MNKSQCTNRCQNKLQQNVKSLNKDKPKTTALLASSNTKTTVSYKHHIPACNQPNTNGHDKNEQKSKATYSAQYQAPYTSRQQNFNPNNSSPFNIPNMGGADYPSCNTMPLYNVPTRMINNGQNIPMENAGPSNNMRYSCPCSNFPPPMPPCKDDLWDLQFCRWWGWNWIRKREEMMNQKKTEMKTKRVTSPDVEKRNNPRRRRKQHDFFSWCNKLFRPPPKRDTSLKDEEKQQLQELYNTPCSSITFNNKNPTDDWECRSVNVKRQQCYGGSTRQTSMSTVMVQSKTRHQRCKQNMRKHQSWVCEKTDSSSSDELCSHICVCPQRNDSSTEESIEYLSMRMAQVKSDYEVNEECCTCTKPKEIGKNVCCPCNVQKKQETNMCCPCMIKVNPDCCTCMKPKETEKKVSCPCNVEKKQETNVCCPCMIKLVYKKPTNYNKYSKQKCCPNTVEQKVTKCNCSRSLSPCRSLPVCRPPPPRKVPQFCRLPNSGRSQQPLISYPECRKRPKRKYSDCNCQKKRECIVGCRCEQPRKKIRTSRKPKEVYCYYCCCNNCCCCNKKNASAEITKESNAKSETNLKETTDKRISSKKIVENCNVTSDSNNNYQPQCYQMYTQVNDANFCKNFPIGDCIQDKVYNTGQFTVSKALQEGLYTSPLTGRLYNLNPKTCTVNQVFPQCNLPDPLDVNEKVFDINSVESPVADEEHKVLLTAVCEAIMSSRFSNRRGQTHTHPIPEFSPNHNRWRHTRPTVNKLPRNYDHLSHDIHVGSDGTHNTIPALSKPFDYNILLSPSNVKVPILNFGVSENCKYNVKTLPKQKSVSNMSGKSRYFITNGKHGPIRQRAAESQNYTNFIANEQTLLQVPRNVPLLEEKYSMNSLNSENSFNSLEAFSSTNIYETYNVKPSSLQNRYATGLTASPNLPTIQKSSSDNSNGASGDSSNSGDTVIKKNLAKEETESLIPFNSPRNWIKPPKLTGISMTGLFSTVGDTKEFAKTSKYNNKKTNDKSRHDNFNSEQLKKQRLYNSLFLNDYSDYAEDFPNLSYNFSQFPNSQSTARNPMIYPSLILQELSSVAAQATQTSMPKTSAPKDCSESGCTCKNEECKNQTEKEVDSSKLIKENNPLHKSSQFPRSSAFEITTQTPESSILKAIPANSTMTQTGITKIAKASNTIHSMSPPGYSKPIETTQVFHFNKEIDSPRAPPKSQLANNSKPTETRTTATGIGQLKPSQTTQSKTTNINSQSSGIAASKSTETSDHGQIKENSTSILFTTEDNSEKEMGCRYYNEKSSSYSGPATLPQYEKALKQNSGGICVYVQHEPQDINFFANTEVTLGQSEKLLAVVDRISDVHLSNLSLAPKHTPLQDMATTSKCEECTSSHTENLQPLPKSFISAIPTPVYINATTSPFKFKYAKARARERSVPENFVKEKVPKRESPFSMFCSPVTSKGVDGAPFSSNDTTETGSFSRPDRQLVLNSKKLKMREKRWRY